MTLSQPAGNSGRPGSSAGARSAAAAQETGLAGTATLEGPPAGTGDRSGVSERGLTEIADRVVEKLAVRLASEVEGVAAGEPVGGLRGALPGLRGGSATSAHAETGLRTARVALTMDVRYPLPAVEVSDQVRTHVIDGLRRFTGLEVDSLTITVRRLVASRPRRRRVE